MQPSFLTFDFEWRPLQNYLAEMGVAPPALLPAATPGDQPPSQALYDWVVRNHGAVVDGLRLGGYYHVSDYGMAGLALMSAETLGDALKVVRAYMLLFNPDIADIRVEHSTPGEIRIAISLNAPPGWSGQARQFHANVLASAAHNLFNELMGRRLSGMGLTLPAGLGDTRAYASHFHMPVRSCGSDIVFHLPAAALGWGIPTANPAVFQTALSLASESFNQLLESEMGGMRQRVAALLASLPERYPDIGQIARHLRLTERTLRRRLAEEGSSYRQILDEARLARARELLERTPLSTEQIAELLGYADASSLRQAFRRWTGVTVNEYRRGKRGA
ncbi:AraC family transcriptional regulator [Pseudomonas paralcaligenes]|uniref:AraC family transcriptional regulator n=1 Tax=Pseudomonas paralcaligenes TaxID=2772558 RepID=UPI001C821DC7|nr:AraC family transcriptional regulator [Pseudomonas paralcaligenes]